MTTRATKKGETMRRIYAVLHRNPDLTSAEVRAHLPDLTYSAVYCALNKMKNNGAVEVRGKRQVAVPGRRASSYDVYHVKYKSGAIPKVKTKGKAKVKAKTKTKAKAAPVAPKVEAPKVEAPSELKKALQLNRILQQLTGELALDLETTRLDLKAAKHGHDCWWCRVKKVFS